MFSTIDVLVNNGRIFYAKPCTDFTTDDFDALASVNLLGFLYITQMAVKQMVKRKSGSAVTVTGTLADNPIACVNTSVSMIKNFNAVASGAVDTPLHKDDLKDSPSTLQPLGKSGTAQDMVDAPFTWQKQMK